MTTERILLVDDNKGQRVTLESILKRSGYDVVSADCGNAAARGRGATSRRLRRSS